MSAGTARLVDSHVHLQDPQFDADLPAVLRRGGEAGVRYLVCNGTSEEDWPAVRRLAKEHPAIVPCFGLHPWYVGKRSAGWLSTLEEFLNEVPSGLGEIGLDRWIEPRDERAQEQVFRAQLELARQCRRPVMVHCVRAWGWLMDVLASEPPLPAGMLIHAYGGSAELIEPLVQRGAYFSFAGSVLEARRERARESLRTVPRDRLLLETDAPELTPPEPYRPADLKFFEDQPRNEPVALAIILREAARLRGEPKEVLAEAIWANSRRFLQDVRALE